MKLISLPHSYIFNPRRLTLSLCIILFLIAGNHYPGSGGWSFNTYTVKLTLVQTCADILAKKGRTQQESELLLDSCHFVYQDLRGKGRTQQESELLLDSCHFVYQDLRGKCRTQVPNKSVLLLDSCPFVYQDLRGMESCRNISSSF